jgi:hypothetical protein
MDVELSGAQRRFFRDELRSARAAALLDSEGYEPIVLALERLGSTLNRKGHGLGDYKSALLEIARSDNSGLSTWRGSELVPTAVALYRIVQDGRNEAVHQGAHARHFVRHCIELSLAIEDGLMDGSSSISDFMVRDPSCVELWQPIAFARQQMLVNSFSHLPICIDGVWHVLSDKSIAIYLAEAVRPKQALRLSIGEAMKEAGLQLDIARCVSPNATVREALLVCEVSVILILDADRNHLMGIATPFDLL